jgi:chaperonin cofactor prefoldin
MLTMVKDKRSALLRDQIQELKEEASALADRAKKTTRQAEILAERIKDLEKQLAKRS